MTDITDKDRRDARRWAENWRGDIDNDTSAAARAILATVDAPEPTLADEIRGMPDFTMSGENCINDCNERADTLATRAEQVRAARKALEEA